MSHAAAPIRSPLRDGGAKAMTEHVTNSLPGYETVLASAVAFLLLAPPHARIWQSTGILGLLTLVVDRRISAYFLRIYNTSSDHAQDEINAAPKLKFQCELPFLVDYRAPYHHFHTLELSAQLVGFSFAADETNTANHMVNTPPKASFVRAEAFHAAVLQYRPTALSEQQSVPGMVSVNSSRTRRSRGSRKSSTNLGDTSNGKTRHKKRKNKLKRAFKSVKGLMTSSSSTHEDPNSRASFKNVIEIGSVTNAKHLGHVGVNADGQMEVRNLPKEWMEVFEQAGISPQDLSDPVTRTVIIDTLQQVQLASIQQQNLEQPNAGFEKHRSNNNNNNTSPPAPPPRITMHALPSSSSEPPPLPPNKPPSPTDAPISAAAGGNRHIRGSAGNGHIRNGRNGSIGQTSDNDYVDRTGCNDTLSKSASEPGLAGPPPRPIRTTCSAHVKTNDVIKVLPPPVPRRTLSLSPQHSQLSSQHNMIAAQPPTPPRRTVPPPSIPTRSKNDVNQRENDNVDGKSHIIGDQQVSPKRPPSSSPPASSATAVGVAGKMHAGRVDDVKQVSGLMAQLNGFDKGKLVAPSSSERESPKSATAAAPSLLSAIGEFKRAGLRPVSDRPRSGGEQEESLSAGEVSTIADALRQRLKSVRLHLVSESDDGTNNDSSEDDQSSGWSDE